MPGPGNPYASGLFGPLPGVQQTPPDDGSLFSTFSAPALMKPMAAPPPLPVSAFDRFKFNVSRLPDRVASGLFQPQDGGFLSPDDQKTARDSGMMDLGLSLLAGAHGTDGGNAPSVGQALLGAVDHARNAYGQASQTAVQNQMLGTQRHILAGRNAIGQFLAENMTGSQDQQMQAIRQAYMMATAIGDTETAKALQGIVEKGMDAPSLLSVANGGETHLVNPKTGQDVRVMQHTPTPMSDEARQAHEDSVQLRLASLQNRMDQQSFQRAQMMVGQFEQVAKPQVDAAQALGTLYSQKTAALRGDALAQMDALLAFVKLQHPNAVVRPTELHMYANTMGLGDKAQQLIMKLEKGSPLSTGQMLQIYHLTDELARQRSKEFGTKLRAYQQRATAHGVDASIFINPFDDLPAPAPATSGVNGVTRWLPGFQAEP